MKNFAAAARLGVLVLFATSLLTGCKKADSPQFSPAPGTYTGTQIVAISSATFGATIVYTTDGTSPSCQKEHGTIYSEPVAVAANTTLKAMACALLRAESVITTGVYTIRPPETVATPEFSPAAGTYITTQSVSITSVTAGATIRYTSDGIPASCASGTEYSGPIEVAQNTSLSAIGCAAGKIDSAVANATYVITPPAAPPVFDPAPGAYTSVQQVTITSTTSGASFRYSTDGSEPNCSTGSTYGGAIAIANTQTLKAVACAAGFAGSLVTSGGYDITLPPEESVWKSIDFNNGANTAQGTHSTNEDGNALNISSRGKVESGQQVFHFVYASVTGDFVMTARLDGFDFGGLVSNQGRTGLLLTPDLTATTNNLVYASSTLAATSPLSFLRTHRLAAGTTNSNSTIATNGTGVRYLKLTRNGNTYQAAASADGGVNYVSTGTSFTAVLPASVYVGFMISSSSNTASASATFSDVHVRDLAGNEIIGPNKFTGDIGSGTPGGGGGDPTPPPPGPTQPEDLSRGQTPAEPALVSNAPRFNLEGYAAGPVTGGGNIPDTDSRYRKVTTASELVAAIRDAKASGSNPVKVIEIMNDLNLGWNEVGTLLQAQPSNPLRQQNSAAKKHPALIASGVTLLDIQAFNGLTIFSRNGATIRHAEFNIKSGTNLILRNLKFDELWEWDEATKGAYDSNDWDFVTIGDGGGVTSGIWIDHCTFTKSYDGVLDIKKGASAITVSWSEVAPAAAGPGSFVQRQFDDLETNRTSNAMYNLLRGAFTQQQIVDIALPQKKGHLIGSTDMEGISTYTVTLHHNYYKDLQDRMPRLRGGDVQVYNLYVDSSNARLVKMMRDGIVAGNATLAAQLSSTYSFGITSQASISTEGGAVEVLGSVFFGVLTPFRNNQTAVTNPLYTGAIRGFGNKHILLTTDTAYMPASSQQDPFMDRGFEWASWTGDSDAVGSTFGPTQAPQVPFEWNNPAPAYPMTLDSLAALPELLTGPQGAGAGKIGMTTQQWLQVAN